MTEKDSLVASEESSFVFSSFHKVVAVLLVIVFAMVIGNILFGTRSLEVLMDLNKKEEKLKQQVHQEQVKNKKLHKKLLELDLMLPDEK